MVSEVDSNEWDSIMGASDNKGNPDLRSTMMQALAQHLNGLDITAAQAASMLGVSESLIAELQRGNIDAFTLEDLTALSDAAGLEAR